MESIGAGLAKNAASSAISNIKKKFSSKE